MRWVVPDVHSVMITEQKLSNLTYYKIGIKSTALGSSFLERMHEPRNST